MSDKAELERNKAVALRFKKSQGTRDMPQVEKEVLAPNYNRIRGGNFHLASNARGEGWPEPGMYLRTAFPDRVDIIEHVVADGDTVGLLFRLNATHTGNLFGIPPTGKKINVYEIALLRIVNGQMVEGWFMMDEAALLRQLGAKMPVRKDGRIMGIRMLAIYGNLPGLLVSGPLIAGFGYPVTATLYCAIGIAFTLIIALNWREHLWRLGAPANKR